jgi:eukaryotic-like serine/threonine-protein kinase
MKIVPSGTTFLGPSSEIFRVTDFLDAGGFGQVYRAIGKSSGKVIALKTIPLDALDDSSARHALLNEIRAAEKVRHPNVVEVLYVNDGQDSEIGPYIIMEYVAGGTLAKHIGEANPQTLPLPHATKTMLDISQGARAINERFVHRDIRPHNILWTGAVFKIGDFGISKIAAEATRSYTFKGCQHVMYMAPEGWLGHGNTIKVDIYSCGLTFYEVLTGRHPFAGVVKDSNNLQEWERVHLFEQCPDVRDLRHDVNSAVGQLLFRMVKKRAEERPDWDEILRVLSMQDMAESASNPRISAAVEAAVAQQRLQDQARSAQELRDAERKKQVDLYSFSCRSLLEQLEPSVREFNKKCHVGKIAAARDAGITRFQMPGGQSVSIAFFEPRIPPLQLRHGLLFGGGWIGLRNGRSANLLLVRTRPDDLYGGWSICELTLSAFVSSAAVLSELGLREGQPTPFGLKDTYFYDNIRHINGAAHVLNYHIRNDVVAYFEELMASAWA